MSDQPTILCQLAYSYGTDKCPQIQHSYTPFYFELLNNKRQTVKKMLEIGIGYPDGMPHAVNQNGPYLFGPSLYMWRDFFPNAHIYGADIRPQSLFEADRISTYLCDQSNKEDLHRLIQHMGNDIDLIIDDGSHRFEHQRFSCRTLMPLLKKDVIYIVEDVIHSRRLVNSLREYDCQVPPIANQHGSNQLVVVQHKTAAFRHV